ncbi:MAG: vitamin B12 dependent-methionine synthase activation domain-containing protein [Thermoanaerobaculia bacterium]
MSTCGVTPSRRWRSRPPRARPSGCTASCGATGASDPPETTAQDRFAARYRGKRHSFGYPACPDLAGQRALFAALRPEEIGVELTEGDMMDPSVGLGARSPIPTPATSASRCRANRELPACVSRAFTGSK